MRTLIIPIVLLLSACGSVQDAIDEIREGSPLPALLESLWDGDYRERNEEFIINYPVGYTDKVVSAVQEIWEGLEACTGFSVDIAHAPLIISYLPVEELTDPDFGGFAWLDISYTEVVIDDLLGSDAWVPFNITENMLLRYMLYQTGSTIEDLEGPDIAYRECLTKDRT